MKESLLSLYYLCQIKSSRQEQAALSGAPQQPSTQLALFTHCWVAGIIPHLQRFIRTNHSLNQFAYPMACWLGMTSTRFAARSSDFGP